MTRKTLFVDHTGMLAGGELSLLDIARYYKDSSKVLLLADGPFRERLAQVGVTVEVSRAPRTITSIKREGSGIQELRAVPGILKLSLRVARLLRKYDLLYANSQKALVVGAVAGTLSGKPVIWHLHDMLTAEHFSGVHRWLAVTLANRFVARVIANSEATAMAFAESGGQIEKAHVVYNGIDPGPFERVAPAEVDKLRRGLGLAGVPVVSMFGRLASWKGQHVFLEALAHVPGVHALLVGAPLFGESDYLEDLRQLAKTLGVANRVHFLGFRSDIPLLMRMSEVVVHASVSPEPFGRVIVEAMLAGRPVVATRAGGAVEIVDDEVNGILVPAGDANALAGALTDLLANPAKAQTLAEMGYKTALQRFSLQSMLKGVEQQMQQALAPDRNR